MTNPGARAGEPRPHHDDWRLLAVLGLYRLALVAILLLTHRAGYAPEFVNLLEPQHFYHGCLGYALTGLILQLLGVYRRPGLRTQNHLNFAIDTLAIATLVYNTGGVGSGLGILLVPPVIGSSLMLNPRLAAVHAAAATLSIFAAEALHQLHVAVPSTSDFSQAGLLGLMFFAAGMAASVVAQRARRSEAMAERVGSQYVNLARLSETIIETMQTGVIVVDAHDQIRTANVAARRLTGVDPVLGRSLEARLPELFNALRLWRERREPGTMPCAVGAGGREVLPRFTALGWGADADVLVLIDDAAQLRQQAQQMKLASLGRLSAGIAHEIRNPLSAITQASQLLGESRDLNAEDRRLLDMVLRHAARIDHIVGDVLDLSRRNNAELTELQLRQWLEHTLRVYHESHPHSRRPIDMSGVASDISVRFDPEHLRQILFNLWDNSFEHGAATENGVEVKLRTSIDLNSIPSLHVTDNGGGIDPALCDRVFEPFFTTDASGTGLGLYLCRELCEYNGASLQYRPAPGGASFSIRFGDAARAQR
ncbi:MAG: ATP-binding protein [Nevskiales bacterium]|nr:ATP-binding protein [Nevskiales bacterium]